MNAKKVPLLPPEYTTAERDAIRPSLRKLGSIIYNSTTTKHEKWNGTTWENIGDGVDGADGTNAYTYVAYADNASGTGFSLSPAGKTFVAFLTSATPLTPVVGDFAGLWRQYVGGGSSSLPTKRVIVSWGQSSFPCGVRILDADTLKLSPVISLGFANPSFALSAKNGANGKIFLLSAAFGQLFDANLNLDSTPFAANLGNVSPIYDVATDSFYTFSNTNRPLRINASTLAITQGSPFGSSLQNRSAVGGGRLVVMNMTEASVEVFNSTTLAFQQSISITGIRDLKYNGDKNVFIVAANNGYYEINAATLVLTPIISTPVTTTSCAYGNGKYVLGTSSTIYIFNANTNTLVSTLNVGASSMTFGNGRFYGIGSSIVVIDATTNALLTELPLISGSNSVTGVGFGRLLTYQDVS